MTTKLPINEFVRWLFSRKDADVENVNEETIALEVEENARLTFGEFKTLIHIPQPVSNNPLKIEHSIADLSPKPEANIQKASLHLELAHLAEKHHDFELAAKELEEGLTYIQNESIPEYNLTKLNLLVFLGRVLVHGGKLKDAQERWKQALAFAEKINNLERISTIKMNLGVLMEMMNNVATAEHYFDESLDTAQQIGNYEILSNIETNRGVYATRREDYQDALKHFEASLKWAEEARSPELVFWANMNLGDVANYLANYNLAQSYFQEAFNLAQRMGNDVLLTASLTNLGMAYETQGKKREFQIPRENRLTSPLDVKKDVSDELKS